jgi:hypothetical protein
MNKFIKFFVLIFLVGTLTSCDIITYYDCKRSAEKDGWESGEAATHCRGNN